MTELILRIQEDIAKKGYEPHSNEWNIANQLIDIVAVDSRAAELVSRDLRLPEMSVEKMVSEVAKKQYRDPMKVLNELAKFYGVDPPASLPPEYWRSVSGEVEEKPSASAKLVPIKFSLADLMK